MIGIAAESNTDYLKASELVDLIFPFVFNDIVKGPQSTNLDSMRFLKDYPARRMAISIKFESHPELGLPFV